MLPPWIYDRSLTTPVISPIAKATFIAKDEDLDVNVILPKLYLGGIIAGWLFLLDEEKSGRLLISFVRRFMDLVRRVMR